MSSIRDKERRIKEDRIIQATQKGLIGLDGKFGIIVTNLGQPIIRQSDNDFGMFTTSYLQTEDNDEIKTMDIDGTNDDPQGWEWSGGKDRIPATTSQIGWHFDGLSRGMHLEIWYLPESFELKVTYKGYLVYKDIKSEIQAYAPFPDWEDKIDTLYKIALEKEKNRRNKEKHERIEESNAKKLSWLQKLRLRWGI